MPELNRLIMTRVVAKPEALDTAVWPDDVKLIRIASDELLVHPVVETPAINDPHAIIIRDGSFAGLWLPENEALTFLSHSCEWELPQERPAFAQGAVGGIATKILFEETRLFFIVPAAMAAEFEERFS